MGLIPKKLSNSTSQRCRKIKPKPKISGRKRRVKTRGKETKQILKKTISEIKNFLRKWISHCSNKREGKKTLTNQIRVGKRNAITNTVKIKTKNYYKQLNAKNWKI